MKLLPFGLLALSLPLVAAEPPSGPPISTTPPPLTGEWKKIQVTDKFWAEGACVADVNKDGHMDILYGPYWYEGPDFKKEHTIYPATATFQHKKADGTEETIPGFAGYLSGINKYSDNFLSYAYDINGDGWPDYVVIGFPGLKTSWYENPKGKDEPWKEHIILDNTDNESPMFVDITGDGKPELLCMSGGKVGYAECDWAHPEEKWKWHAVSPKGSYQRFTHGIGYGDINGDGRIDILEAHGWWEQPASREGDPVWKFHEAQFGEGGSQMYGYDVNGDGKTDVICTLAAHKYGLAWFEQVDDGGVIGWKKHLLTGVPGQEGETGITFSQGHAVDLVDMNGDGLKDIVVGKRFWAHGPEGDPEPNAPAVLYWFELKREGKEAKWIPHIIDNDSGVGTEVMAVDVDGDGRPDVVVGNKRGLFVFLHTGGK